MNNQAFSLLITVIGYLIGVELKKRFKNPFVNPILIGSIFVVIVLSLTNSDYFIYQSNTSLLTFFITPATLCLAIGLYKQLHLFNQHKKAILLGITVGVVVNMALILLVSVLFKFSDIQFYSILPKSITVALGIAISEQFGGIIALSVFSIVLTGLTGNILATIILNSFKITHPIAQGIAIGTASHIVGTSKANELGPVQGAMSSLSIVVTGLITLLFIIILNPLFQQLLK